MIIEDNLINELKNKNVFVFGLGKSGLSILKKINPFCKRIKALDTNPDYIKSNNLDELAKDADVELFIGKENISPINLLKNIDIFIVSPGVRSDHELIKLAKRKKIPVLSEIEFAWQFMSENQKRKTIAVTGTNGKTTLTTFLGFVFNESGKRAVTCGNIGNPLIDTLNFKYPSVNTGKYIEDDEVIRIIEVSSFQLENIISFAPFCSIILNITEDHIDRHKSMINYAQAKFNISRFQKEEDYLFLNIDDEYIQRIMDSDMFDDIKSKKINFSLDNDKISNLFSKDEILYYNLENKKGSIDSSCRQLIGFHNKLNILAGLGVLKIFGVEDKYIEKSIKKFSPLPHRLEFVGEIKGVKCFNDSKATNPDATIKALENFSGNITLILGGLDKGMDLSNLIPVLKRKVKNIILIGKCRFKLFNLLNSENNLFKSIMVSDNFEGAVKKGLDITDKGGYFILSPSCASMDMFKDYKDRGNKFKKILMEINKKDFKA
ncbi:MAG: UDP-N-acetylmuramoyl-L-alanine--D-glutamate ligase [Actinomycetota bacterium]|nr:UDP-N-acetylmuramoyl-L-alanine--D-glutamate ligase [Actinomycetota bacterium]